VLLILFTVHRVLFLHLFFGGGKLP